MRHDWGPIIFSSIASNTLALQLDGSEQQQSVIQSVYTMLFYAMFMSIANYDLPSTNLLLIYFFAVYCNIICKYIKFGVQDYVLGVSHPVSLFVTLVLLLQCF